jgi:ubiquinone/menaquinone biosynthesis C-methylase UbiE/uncharacterized protein YbaR (Trm112 family)
MLSIKPLEKTNKSSVDLTHVQCPSCSASVRQISDAELACRVCSQSYPIVDGIPLLMIDANRDCALDLAEYESDHPFNPEQRLQIFNVYNAAMKKHDIQEGACLEIGSGTGNLTAGLVDHSKFDEIHCSDISLRFLRRLRQMTNSSSKMRYWIFDASALPFRSNCMSAVFGHSVLHHLLEYEAALRDIFRVLRPGGLAMFGEPIMDSHAITSFCAALIWEMERRHPTGEWAERDLNILKSIGVMCANIGRRMRESRKELTNVEDKHMYVITDMMELAKDIGFREFEYQNAVAPKQIGHDHKWRLLTTLKRYGVSETKLKPYDFIFNQLSESYGTAMGSAAPYNFGYFILQK